ncbi:unnamed protein product [Clonostachys solani]|uniref:Uncharacterized protein n=1 Tax=Clonostachys solani TaxID=160281 RepID=A0A9N9YXH7_9HYPO|nr:unnamed protein product [Clonostachys solani]
MTSPPDHLQMVSLRGEEYVFELKGTMPDGLIEVYRQLYMDSFLMFVLPVDSETIGSYRSKSVWSILNFCIEERHHRTPSSLLSMRFDRTVWDWMFAVYLPQGQAAPAFPWPMPPRDPAEPPSPILQAWRRKIGLSCEDETPKDSSSTDSMLSNALRLSTQEKVQEFLEEEQLTQWYTTRATLPKKPANRASNRQRPLTDNTLQSLDTTALHLDMSIGVTDQGRHLDMSIGATDQGRRLDMSVGATDQGRRLDMSIDVIDQGRRAHKGINVEEQHHLDAVRNLPFQGQRHESEALLLIRRQVPHSSEVSRSRPVDRIGIYSQTTSDGTSNLYAINNSFGGGAQSNIYLRDVATIGRALQKESKSGKVSVRMMPVHDRQSKHDPKKLPWDSEAFAKHDRNSYEIIDDDTIIKPDPSMGRDELDRRFDLEPLEPRQEGQDMNMTGSTPGGLTSITEAQGNTTGPGTIESSILGGLGGSAATS